jgi:transposase
MLRYSAPPGYQRSHPRSRPKLDPFTGIIDEILESDRSGPRKQRHTARRILERLRDEHGFTGGYTIVKDLYGFRALWTIRGDTLRDTF